RGVDRSVDKIRDYAAAHGFTPTDSLADVLCDPAIRAVVLATPHSLHCEQVVACAEAGKQVFCEKPFALQLRDARRMVEACRHAGVVLGVGHNRRFWPSFRTLREIVTRGELGDILHIEGHNSNENSNAVLGGWRLEPSESPAGGMTGAGLHVLDAFVSLLGPVRRVHAQLVERKPPPVPLDSLALTLEFAGGISGQMATVRAMPLFFRVHVFGTRGSAELRGETEVTVRLGNAPPRRFEFAPVDSQRAEIEAFCDAVEGRAPYPVDTAQILATVAAFEATVRAVESGTTVEVDPA
ncbi:MAG: Gfo/Idh/MocA family oxidoreductase, partial [Proteobacteria bacterium]|nr:Gfo/Idh/MocA family oxidoreductase [Pseudomonadota bacterium]